MHPESVTVLLSDVLVQCQQPHTSKEFQRKLFCEIVVIVLVQSERQYKSPTFW